jgi:hypothetical protein
MGLDGVVLDCNDEAVNAHGFTLWLDPQQVDPDARDLVSRRLRLAMESIDQLQDQETSAEPQNEGNGDSSG